ncbi:MAG TPA: hypothetical protein PKX16_09890, partial [Kiritimatiellia bacterium]|nr:hypothetical protein [Kiritimatiellia bacterium]
MKREKSRAGCMTVLIATVAVLGIITVAGLMRWLGGRETETAAPADLPALSETAEVLPEAPPPVPPAAPEAAPAAPPAPAAAPPPPPSAPAAPVVEPSPPTAATTAGDAAGMFAQARERLQAGDYQGARQAALDALAARPGDAGI